MKGNILLVLVAVAALFMAVLSNGAYAEPIAANFTIQESSRADNQTEVGVSAQAGNVTRMDISQKSITGTWAGFYGNVSGTITLDDSSGNTFYDWNFATITGEIFAARTTPDWGSPVCTTSAQLQAEETALVITNTDPDSINLTFLNTNTHPAITVAGDTITADSCFATNPYDGTGSQTSKYPNLMLTAGTTVYTAVINNSVSGFDSNLHDFEILVPTNTSQALTTYYFYVELG